ncbi:hypothetical protein EMPG_10282 [Blastomyces silverae]|uniref:Uncharacterized protein n=1 Tax=Blastomyces silverae TaxID=2060906 RepID=A0A0H1B5J5_9EURO|nr:hypothetical protein EMPG_10282 [Blastomyces silverae]
MFALRHLEAWRQSVAEFFTPNTTDLPTRNEISAAFYNAVEITAALDTCKHRFNWYNPPFTHGIQLVEEVHQALRDDHGGVRPRDVLYIWLDQRDSWIRDHRIFATLEEKKAMVALFERWNDRDRLKKQFWGLMLDDRNNGVLHYRYFTHERSLQVYQCLREWLEKRKAGQVY